jgi:hypothetical protein
MSPLNGEVTLHGLMEISDLETIADSLEAR